VRGPEIRLEIRAWLEEGEVGGRRRTFRGRLTLSDARRGVGVSSVADLHRALDEILDARGLLPAGPEDPDPAP
jgi:hypothetical protein